MYRAVLAGPFELCVYIYTGYSEYDIITLKAHILPIFDHNKLYLIVMIDHQIFGIILLHTIPVRLLLSGLFYKMFGFGRFELFASVGK